MGVLVWLTALGGLASGQSPAPRVVVEFYHVDALGSVRAITNAQGQVVREADYAPFGEEVAPPRKRAPNTRRFTGKERDTETGLDYFGARYYRADVGRFTTVDPVMGISENLVDPQRWNRYAYARNNPLTYVDRDGRWPLSIHRTIFSSAFPRLTGAQIDLMDAGSRWADLRMGDPLHSPAHGMSDGTTGPPQTVQQARALYLGWVGSFESQARGLSSFWHFGVAGHAIADTFSPSHAGFQPWFGVAPWDWSGDAMHYSQDNASSDKCRTESRDGFRHP